MTHQLGRRNGLAAFVRRCSGAACAVLAIGCIPVIARAADATNPSDDPSSVTGARYQLVWSDEFDADGPPDPANWTYERGFVRNQELQWYQPENARCEDGLLVIEARREQVENPRYDAQSDDWRRNRRHAEYTSACITTRGRHEWRYGRLEMRARIDVRRGLWPAFWTLGSARRWPGCGEVDIMEYYRGELLANVAWAGRRGRPRWDATSRPLHELGGDDWPTQFHVWRMDWDSDEINLYVDDHLLNTVDLETTINPDGSNPLREPHYILLNLAIGGTQGGDPAGTEFPARFEIDYVRVYQRVDHEEQERTEATEGSE